MSFMRHKWGWEECSECHARNERDVIALLKGGVRKLRAVSRGIVEGSSHFV
jgi:hypothetical protein